MSHFTVLVVTKEDESLDDVMAPFQENNMGDCPQEFMEFEDKEDEFKSDWKNGKTKAVKLPDGTYCLPCDRRFEVKEEKTGFNTHKAPDNLTTEKVSFKKLYKNFKQFCKDWHGHDGRDKLEGRYGYWQNPQSKWDWYQVGGRWAGYFLLKPGCVGDPGERSALSDEGEIPHNKASSCRKGDVDWETMERAQKAGLEKNWEEAQSVIKDKVALSYHYGIKEGMTKEQYMNEHMGIHTFAILMDGVWHESGEMGWWAVVRNEKDGDKWRNETQSLLDAIAESATISIVDCHI